MGEKLPMDVFSPLDDLFHSNASEVLNDLLLCSLLVCSGRRKCSVVLFWFHLSELTRFNFLHPQ